MRLARALALALLGVPSAPAPRVPGWNAPPQEAPPEAPHDAHVGRPGPRSAIAGRAGIRSRSRLDFGGIENRLEAVYVFPDRARWVFESLDRRQRMTFFRYGTEAYQVDGGPSEALEGAALEGLLLQMELRRALLLWPAGFEWREEDGARHAVVHAVTCCRIRPLGELVASGPDPARPSRIEARDASGQTLETLETLAWQDDRPLRLRVSGAAGSFEETIETVDSGFRYLDLAFRPGDRRQRSSATGPGVLVAELVPSTFATHELPAGLDWDAARSAGEAALAALRERLGPGGPALDPLPAFELDDQARPARCLLRLVTATAPPPEGFRTEEERTGLFLSLEAPSQLSAEALRQLRGSAPPEALPGTPYVRLHPGHVELVLPLEAR